MTFDWSVIWTHRAALLEGAALTVGLTVLTMLLAVPGGIVLALMRLSPNKLLQSVSLGFVEFFRNLPLILVIYWAFYVMPMAFDVQFSAITTALVALVLNVAAYNAETFRAGINSIRKGQMEAALAMGMSRRQAMFKVVIPQAARRILPVIASTWISLFKDTSLVSVIAVTELMLATKELISTTFQPFPLYLAAAGIYWVLSLAFEQLQRLLERRLAFPH